MHHDSRRHIVHEDEADNGTSSLDTRLIWAGLFFALAIFSKAPGLDLTVAAKYYSAQAGFFHADDPLVRVLYEWTPNTGRGLVILMLVYALIAPLISKWFAARGKTDLARKSAGPWRHSAVLVVCCALLGPGLLIEGLLKDTMGRPRPLHIEQFGGTEVFHGPFELGADTKTPPQLRQQPRRSGFRLDEPGAELRPGMAQALAAGRRGDGRHHRPGQDDAGGPLPQRHRFCLLWRMVIVRVGSVDRPPVAAWQTQAAGRTGLRPLSRTPPGLNTARHASPPPEK
jgi:hypothetical protein